MKLFRRILSYFRKTKKEEKIIPVVEAPVELDKYDQIQIGDLVWALMPLKPEELEAIEENHRIRPYLIVAKDETDIYGYYCSSKRNNRYLASYKLDKDIYNHRKNTYVYLTNTYKIPRANFKDIYSHVATYNLMMIERKLMVNSRYIRGLIHFDLSITHQIGDIIRVENKLYYIYQIDNTNIYTYQAKFNRDNHFRYDINFATTKIFNAKGTYELVNILAPKVINLIDEEKRKYKFNKKKKQQTKNQNKFLYPRGSIFEDYNGDKIIYLYTRGNHHYGINTKINEFFPYISDIQNIQEANQIGMINDGKMLIMLERLLDQNINPHNIVTTIYKDMMKE